jgi:hypothetical protein
LPGFFVSVSALGPPDFMSGQQGLERLGRIQSDLKVPRGSGWGRYLYQYWAFKLKLGFSRPFLHFFCRSVIF